MIVYLNEDRCLSEGQRYFQYKQFDADMTACCQCTSLISSELFFVTLFQSLDSNLGD